MRWEEVRKGAGQGRHSRPARITVGTAHTVTLSMAARALLDGASHVRIFVDEVEQAIALEPSGTDGFALTRVGSNQAMMGGAKQIRELLMCDVPGVPPQPVRFAAELRDGRLVGTRIVEDAS